MGNSAKSLLDGISQQELYSKISNICATVTSVITAKELLEVSLKKIIDLFGANRGSIFILDSTGKKLTLKIAQGMELSEQKQIVKRLGQGIVGRVAEIKKPLVVDNIANDSRFLNFKPRKSYSTVSFICAPLLIKDKLIGVINITDKKDGHHFNEDELQLLDFLSSQIALNYRRVQLYQKFKRVVKESQNLKNELGKSSKEADELKDQVDKQEKLATIGKLAGGIAHEFNNPLDGVLRYTNLCLEQIDHEDVVHGYLLEIKHGLNRMVNIVKSLLACSRNDTYSKRNIDPNQAIEQAVNGLQPEIFHKNISVELDLSSDLPTIVDLGFERAVSNLLRNSIDALDNNGQIKVESQLIEGAWQVTVADTGSGIKSSESEKIFEPFYTTKDIEKGCGLGLTIVSEIVKSYEGQIKVDSKLKHGTTFTISIPFS